MFQSEINQAAPLMMQPGWMRHLLPFAATITLAVSAAVTAISTVGIAIVAAGVVLVAWRE